MARKRMRIFTEIEDRRREKEKANAERLRRETRIDGLAVSLFLGEIIDMNTSAWSLESSAAAPELKRFIAQKCAQVRAENRAPEHPMSPVSRSFFEAAERSDWLGLFEATATMHRLMREGQSGSA